MTYAIAAAGTGGHVYPGLAVAEALERTGVERSNIIFLGGNRFETEAVPQAGYELFQVELRGLKRSLTLENLAIPNAVWRASRAMRAELERRDARAILATGGYVTVPAGWAARSAGVPLFTHEQNAHAGLANRLMSRFARSAFTSFPHTEGLPDGVHVGNPLRAAFVDFDREALRAHAYAHYELDEGMPTLGVVGGSLGAAVLNAATARLVRDWDGPPIQIVHLAGTKHAESVSLEPNTHGITWRVVAFESHMNLFFAATDLVLARAGGMVAEITATGTPSILVPGAFGSKGHQTSTAAYITDGGAGLTMDEADLSALPGIVHGLLADPDRLAGMADAARALGRPRAADDIAAEMVLAHG